MPTFMADVCVIVALAAGGVLFAACVAVVLGYAGGRRRR